jgi:hypothetical protein
MDTTNGEALEKGKEESLLLKSHKNSIENTTSSNFWNRGDNEKKREIQEAKSTEWPQSAFAAVASIPLWSSLLISHDGAGSRRSASVVIQSGGRGGGKGGGKLPYVGRKKDETLHYTVAVLCFALNGVEN